MKHSLGRGSHINRPTWQSNDKRSRFSLFLFLFITSLRLTKDQCLSQLTNFYLLSIWILVLPWTTKIKYERLLILVTILKTKNLNKINTSSYNLVTNFNNPSPLKDRTRSYLHDVSNLPDKIKYISPVVTTTVNVIFVPPKLWRSKPKNKYKLMIFTDVNEKTSINIVVNQWLFLHYGH